MELIAIDGGQLAVLSFGRGPPVIFLQGGPGDTHHSMKQMAAPLAEMFQCIVFDQRGTGQSRIDDRRAVRFHLDCLLDDLTAVQRRFQAASWDIHGALSMRFSPVSGGRTCSGKPRLSPWGLSMRRWNELRPSVCYPSFLKWKEPIGIVCGPNATPRGSAVTHRTRKRPTAR